jgi:hypothetical protein
LRHTSLKIARWRHPLIGYGESEIVQYLEFGFPIGLSRDPQPNLSSTLRNHGSSLQYFKHIDSVIEKGLQLGDTLGPLGCNPFDILHISPLMTSPKKPSSRRAVFDASFGDLSLNNNTPSDQYMGQPIITLATTPWQAV